MSKNDFLKKQNVSLLWEVIMDDDLMKNKHQSEISHIIDIFNVNLKKFHDSTNNNNLIELNKNYITVMMNFINKNFSKPEPIPPNKPQPKNLITYEEIQNDRLSQFERDFNNRQQEFTSAMSLPVPPAPDFSDKTDGPLTEIEVEVKRYMAQRNYDVEQLNKTMNNDNDNKGNASSWLKPQETSLKSEKVPLINNSKLNSSPLKSNLSPIKYIKIDKVSNISENVIQNEVIDLTSKKKTISWATNIEEPNSIEEENTIEDDQQIVLNIFSKLKTIPIPSKKDDFINNNNNNEELIFLKSEMKVLHQKLDTILKLLNVNK
jgi:hypothetical protein